MLFRQVGRVFLDGQIVCIVVSKKNDFNHIGYLVPSADRAFGAR